MKAGVWSLLRPSGDGWELWKFQPGSPPAISPNPTAAALRSTPALTVTLPTSDLLGVPLWLPAAGDLRELASLELSSRHLLRRGRDVECLPIATRDSRALVLAVSAEESPRVPPSLPPSSRFEAVARTWPPDGADVILWKEAETVCFAVYRGPDCVYFSVAGPRINPAICGAIRRTLLRLESENVLERSPRLARVYGEFPDCDRRALIDGLGFPIEYSPEPPPPRLPASPADVPPPSVRELRTRQKRRARAATFALAGFAVYGLVAALFLGDLFLQRWRVHHLRDEAAALAPAAAAARSEIARWKAVRPAVDPGTFALDLLSSVAAQLPGDQVRLTHFALDDGVLSVSGEAREVSQAYTFIDKVKSAVSEFDWTASQPQLIGQQSVRFSMEGRRPDAHVVTE